MVLIQWNSGTHTKGPNMEDIRIPSKAACDNYQDDARKNVQQLIEEQRKRDLEIAKQGIVPLKRAISDSVLIGSRLRLDDNDCYKLHDGEFSLDYKMRKAMEHCWDEINQWALQQGVELTIEHKFNFTKINHRWVE